MTEPRTGPDPQYDPETGTYLVEWDPSGADDPGIRIVLSVAAVADVDHTELTPLNDVVDPDALNSIFAPRKDGVNREGGLVRFTLSAHEITVHSEGRIVINPPGDDHAV